MKTSGTARCARLGKLTHGGTDDVTRSGRERVIASYLHDVSMAAIAFLLALLLRLGDELLIWPRDVILSGLAIFTAVAATIFLWMRLHRIIWRYASIGDLSRIVQATVLTVVIFVTLQFFYNRLADFPRSFLVIEIFVLTTLLAAPRFLYRFLKDGELSALLERNAHTRVPVLLIGAGDGADLFIREMTRGREAPYRVVGIVDDRGSRVGRNIRGIPVLGRLNDIGVVVDELRARGIAPQRILITHAQIDGTVVRKIIESAEVLGLAVARIPRLIALDEADQANNSLIPRPIDVQDVLGRAQNVLDHKPVDTMITGRRVLVTGAGGTIGAELASQIAMHKPSELALLDISEYLLYQADLQIKDLHPDLVRHIMLGDVRDRTRIDEVIRDFAPEIVLHTAALKHVPLVESNPLEGILTNATGTRNLAEACQRAGVETMVLISTDKAVDPTNVMGASKRLAEMYCQALDIDGQQSSFTRFITVRFGNVLGSTGSVIPLFQRQIAAGGPVTVTHPEMTRYFMTVREAVSLVLQSAAMNDKDSGREPGGICVLDMGEPVRILDLAQQLIRLSGLVPGNDIQIVFTGPRPGEKLHEVLFHDQEVLRETTLKPIRIVTPRTAELRFLQQSFEKLESAARERNTAGSLSILQSLVPEFQVNQAPYWEADSIVSGTNN
ncbi:MAG: nucleotide sugar dehydratase [Rhodospirillaceae bacterium]|nr:nucleotide sugar dehydratase [Rhodospirillaceae bacterium]